MTPILLVDDDEEDQVFFKNPVRCIDPTLQCETAINQKIALDTLKINPDLPEIIFPDCRKKLKIN